MSDKSSVRAGIKVTPELLKAMRDKVVELIQATNGAQPYIEVAKSLSTFYPAIAVRTLVDYVACLDPARTSDYLIELAVSKQVSIGFFMEVARGALDKVSKDTLAQEALRHPRIEVGGIAKIKRILAEGGGHVSLAAAIMKVRNRIPDHAKPEDVKKSLKLLGGISRDLNDAALLFQTRMEEAIDLIPGSVMENASEFIDMYHKLSSFEVTLANALRYIKEAKPRFMDVVRKHVMMEAGMNNERIEGGL